MNQVKDLWAGVRAQAWPWREWAGEIAPVATPHPQKVDWTAWEMGLGVLVPSLFEHQKGALALLRDQPCCDSPPTWAAALVIAPDQEQRVLQRAGLLGLVQAFVESMRLQPLHELAHPPRYRWLGTKEEVDSGPIQDLRLLQNLRHRLALAPQAEYQRVVDWAQSVRAEAPLDVRCALAALLPDQHWAEEEAQACLQAPMHSWGYRIWPNYGWALLASLRQAEVAQQLLESTRHIPPPPELAACLLANLGEAAYPILFQRMASSDRERWAASLWDLPEPKLAAELRVFLEDRALRPKVAAYYEKFPELGAPALAGAVLAGGKSKETARVLLSQMLRRLPELPVMEARERALCEQLRSRYAGGQPEAEVCELPSVLADPPWLSRRQLAPPLVARARSMEFAEQLHSAPGKPYFYSVPPPDGMKDEAAYRRLRKELDNGGTSSLHELDGLTDARALAVWVETPARHWYEPWDGLAPMLRRFGLAGLPGFLLFAERAPHTVVVAVQGVESPGLAPLMAQALQLQKCRKLAAAWLTAYPRAALIGLIPQAVGDSGRRAQAEQAVRWLVSRQGAEQALQLAAQMGVEEALRQVLDFDPLLLLPAKLPKLPVFLDAAGLPRPLLKNGKALSQKAVEHLLTMLSFCPLDPIYAGVEQVREACQPDSLEEFVWEIYAVWQASGAPPKEKWMFQSLALLGADEVARRLGPLVRAWPQESLSARAEQGLDLLALIGTDVALMHIYQMSQKLKSKSLQDKARVKLDEIAARRGLTREELADRLVSDLDLDPDGSCQLDLGDRVLRIRFDQALNPVVCDEHGKVLKTVPKLKGEADKRWKALKKDSKLLGQAQIVRLELAMVGRRRWAASAWELFLLRHPLLVHLVRRLLWGVYVGGELRHCFRVAEDDSLADSQDALFELGTDAEVGLVHPLHLSEADLRAWTQIFNDYKILQPFSQLGRPILRLLPEERTSLEIVRQRGRKVHPGKLLSLQDRGWIRGESWDGGSFGSLRRPGVAELEFGEGIYLGAPHQSGDQELGVLKAEVAWGELDPIDVSEVLAEVEGLR